MPGEPTHPEHSGSAFCHRAAACPRSLWPWHASHSWTRHPLRHALECSAAPPRATGRSTPVPREQPWPRTWPGARGMRHLCASSTSEHVGCEGQTREEWRTGEPMHASDRVGSRGLAPWPHELAAAQPLCGLGAAQPLSEMVAASCPTWARHRSTPSEHLCLQTQRAPCVTEIRPVATGVEWRAVSATRRTRSLPAPTVLGRSGPVPPHVRSAADAGCRVRRRSWASLRSPSRDATTDDRAIGKTKDPGCDVLHHAESDCSQRECLR
jgi:hypothetical protein